MQVRIHLKIVFLIALACFCPSSASVAKEGREYCEIVFAGQLDSRLLSGLEALTERECPQRALVLSSNGGEASISIKIAELIRDYDISVTIKDYCLSSCVEFLIPAANNLSFRDFPVIGVHGNPMLIEFLARHYNPPGIENCRFTSSQKEYEIKSRKSNPEFWKAQLKTLGVENFYVGDADSFFGCPQFDVEFKSDLWILSSAEMDRYLFIAPDEKVCGDDPVVCEKKMRENLGMAGTFKFAAYEDFER